MPLNIQDQGDPKDPQPEKPSVTPPVPPYVPPATPSSVPPKPAPKPAIKPPTLLDDEPPGSGKKLLFWIFGIVVLASAVFLLFQFGILPPGKGARPDGANGPMRVDTASATPQAAAPPAAPEKADDARAAELRQRLARTGGEFTIYISAYATAADADELAGRWERAGYQAAVVHAGGWFRVGLGRFATVEAARAEAEKLRQALEDGYWVGRATPGA